MLPKFWQRIVLSVCLCAVVLMSGVAKAGEMRIVYPANGLYSIQPRCAPNRELTVQDASTADGANVFLWSINSNWHTQPSHQKWRLTRIGNSQWYKIEVENSGKALNVHNGISRNGTNVSVWPYGGKMHQFRFLEAGNGYYVIQPNIGGSVVLDVSNGANSDGANVQVWTWNGSPAQMWKLVSRNRSNAQPANNNTAVKPTANNTMEKRVLDKLWDLSQNVNGYRRETKYTGSGQCRGFANKVYMALFGLSGLGGYTDNNYGASSYTGSHIIGYLHGNFGASDTQAMKHLFQYVKPGSIVQMGRRHSLNSTGTAPNPHTAIVYDVDNNGVFFYEANADGKNTIRVWHYTWAQLADRNKGFTIYEPNNYALK